MSDRDRWGSVRRTRIARGPPSGTSRGVRTSTAGLSGSAADGRSPQASSAGAASVLLMPATVVAARVVRWGGRDRRGRFAGGGWFGRTGGTAEPAGWFPADPAGSPGRIAGVGGPAGERDRADRFAGGGSSGRGPGCRLGSPASRSVLPADRTGGRVVALWSCQTSRR